ncbi:MAG: DUF898 family protein [Bacteroidales bacterium]|nr:DUF898 family protein [Bacteroidales bacterium]
MNSLKFYGKGFDFFKIHFVNVVLTILSLTLLYPWAKVRECRYLCQNTFLAENSFTFSGTVKEFFKGYIKTLLFLMTLFVAAGVLITLTRESIWSVVLMTAIYLVTLAIVYYFMPILLHGSINYRLNNTSWGDIKPSYTGKLSELTPLFFTGIILSSLTAGIYKAWFQVRLSKYILQNFRFGSLRFDFCGKSEKLFFLYLKGVLLCLITFGIYGIWFAKQLYEYSVNNIVVKKDDHEFKLHSDANTLEVFEMVVGNCLLVCLTLGIGASWAYIRYYRFIIEHCTIPAEFNIGSIKEIKSDPMEKENVATSNLHWLDKWNPIFIA